MNKIKENDGKFNFLNKMPKKNKIKQIKELYFLILL